MRCPHHSLPPLPSKSWSLDSSLFYCLPMDLLHSTHSDVVLGWGLHIWLYFFGALCGGQHQGRRRRRQKAPSIRVTWQVSLFFAGKLPYNPKKRSLSSLPKDTKVLALRSKQINYRATLQVCVSTGEKKIFQRICTSTQTNSNEYERRHMSVFPLGKISSAEGSLYTSTTQINTNQNERGEIFSIRQFFSCQRALRCSIQGSFVVGASSMHINTNQFERQHRSVFFLFEKKIERYTNKGGLYSGEKALFASYRIESCDIVWVSDGVAMISKLLKIISLFCKRALSKRLYSAKETYNFKEPTHRSHPILGFIEGTSRLTLLYWDSFKKHFFWHYCTGIYLRNITFDITADKLLHSIKCDPYYIKRSWHITGWLQLVGSLQSQVSFAEHRLFHRVLLQKRHIFLRSQLMVATPYIKRSWHISKRTHFDTGAL